MSLNDFYDFKLLSKYLKNFDLNENKSKVHISGVRVLLFDGEAPHKYFYKYRYNSDVFESVDFFSRGHVSRGQKTKPCVESLQLRPARKDGIPISSSKYNDLISLCLQDIIPSPHHIFYALLPHEGHN